MGGRGRGRRGRGGRSDGGRSAFRRVVEGGSGIEGGVFMWWHSEKALVVLGGG